MKNFIEGDDTPVLQFGNPNLIHYRQSAVACPDRGRRSAHPSRLGPRSRSPDEHFLALRRCPRRHRPLDQRHRHPLRNIPQRRLLRVPPGRFDRLDHGLHLPRPLPGGRLRGQRGRRRHTGMLCVRWRQQPAPVAAAAPTTVAAPPATLPLRRYSRLPFRPLVWLRLLRRISLQAVRDVLRHVLRLLPLQYKYLRGQRRPTGMLCVRWRQPPAADVAAAPTANAVAAAAPSAAAFTTLAAVVATPAAVAAMRRCPRRRRPLEGLQ